LSTMYLLNSWGRVSRQPTPRDKLFHRLLLLKIHSEELVSDGLQSLWVATRLDLPPHPLQLEKPPGGHSHNGSSKEGRDVEEESAVYSRLNFFCSVQIPDVIAIVRFTTADDHDRVLDVEEVIYADTPEDYCKLETDVPQALAHGIDVLLTTHLEPEDLPAINAFIIDVDATEV